MWMDSGGPKEACVSGGTCWRYLSNTIELSLCGSDVAFVSKLLSPLVIVWLQLYNEEILDLLDTTRDPSLKVKFATFCSFVMYLSKCNKKASIR